MASPIPSTPGDLPVERVRAPEADPVSIRACLSPAVAAVFDAEWELVLESAKHSKDLAEVRELLKHWRLHAYQELRDPGSYFRMLASAARAQATGQVPTGAVSGADMQARINARLIEAGARSAEEPAP